MSKIKTNKNKMHEFDERPVSSQTGIVTSTWLDKQFDIAGVSELAHRERSAFKPIYGMSKWWARRSSSLFRALLLSLSLPPDSDLLREFYKNHQKDQEIAGQIILDPFMGGATTLVEGLRLGYKVVGVDINPLSWFIAKTETTQVDLTELQKSFERLETRIAPKIRALYATHCHNCGNEAEIIHAFWVKQAYCQNVECGSEVSLFRDYIVGKRRGDVTVSFYGEECPECGNKFDCEIDSAVIVQPPSLVIDDEDSTWTHRQADNNVQCPQCKHTFVSQTDEHILHKKKVEIHALICSQCWTIFQYRGSLSKQVHCPICNHRFEPRKGTTDGGEFVCTCGQKNKIVASPSLDHPLPFRLYALEVYCSHCQGNESLSLQPSLFPVDNANLEIEDADDGYRFFKRPDKYDLERFDEISNQWEKCKHTLPYPKGEIADYEKTNRLIIHHYRHWHELFNARQLLSLGWLLQSIKEEANPAIRDALLAAFIGTLEHQNMLNIYYVPYAQSAGAFGRHDYHPKVTVCEGNVWGGKKGRGTFVSAYKGVVKGKGYLVKPYDADYSNGTRRNIFPGDSFAGYYTTSFEELARNKQKNILLRAQDSRNLSFIPDNSISHIVTDPPYADAVQYAELADFFYVWLREALQSDSPNLFCDPETPKQSEIVENQRRNKSQRDFYTGLQAVLIECHRVLKPEGRLVFTFHHSKESQWASLLHTLLSAGFELISVYPIHSEGTKSGNLVFHSNPNSVAHDIVHVCRKAPEKRIQNLNVVKWEDLKVELKERVGKHISAILSGREHGQRINRADIQVMLWGECLALYSQNYGNITNGNGEYVNVETVLLESGTIIDQLLLESKLGNG